MPDRAPAYTAAGLAFASAAVTLYWTLGGTMLLDTVGGAIEDLARDRSPAAIALGATTALLKLATGALAVALVWNPPARRRRRLILAAAVASAALILWGGANVLVGALVLTEVIVPADPIDEWALRWHVVLWDPWFLVWGISLALTARRARRRPSAPSYSPTRYAGARSR
jgi:hypothetical protein